MTALPRLQVWTGFGWRTTDGILETPHGFEGIHLSIGGTRWRDRWRYLTTTGYIVIRDGDVLERATHGVSGLR